MTNYLMTTETVLGRFINRVQWMVLADLFIAFVQYLQTPQGQAFHIDAQTMAYINAAYIGLKLIKESADPKVPALTPPQPTWTKLQVPPQTNGTSAK